MKRYFGIGFAIGLLSVLAACGPEKGSPCQHVGDTYGGGGKVLTCKQINKYERQWQ